MRDSKRARDSRNIEVRERREKMGIKTTGTTEIAPIVIRPINTKVVEIPIIGETELITHPMSKKAQEMMLEKQIAPAGQIRKKKEPKDPEREYLEAFHLLSDGSPGFPASGFKAAIVGACRGVDCLPMTRAKVIFRVDGDDGDDLVRIYGIPYKRQDMVRLETGVADIRFRPGFKKWGAILRVKYDADQITLESVVNLLNRGGQGGIGEWRPSAPKSHTGSFGCFHVAVGKEIDEIKALQKVTPKIKR